MKIPSPIYETIRVDHHLFQTEMPECLVIHLNRPDVKNALNPQLIQELIHVFQHDAQQSTIRLVLLHAEGGFFCAGADLTWMQQAANYTNEQNKQDALHLATLFETIDNCPKPTVALIQGGAFGGGVGLAAVCDLSIAQESTVFCLSEVRLGLIPAVISPYLLRTMGYRRGLQLSLTAEKILGKEAYQLDLITHVFPDDQWESGCHDIISTLLKGSPQAHISTKKLFKDISQPLSPEDQRQRTAQAIASARASIDGKEGIAAFLEKRLPYWSKTLLNK